MNKLSDYKKIVLIVEDQLTGFKGKVTGHSDYITGCDQYLVQPDAREGEWKEGRWFDAGRLRVIGKADIAAQEVQAEENGADALAPIK